ncbi:MAG: SPOR domain-containing protein [Gallionellaceae bacterium]|nr:SPOR domain-containing protein [Gallionellaceae bacterium]
MADISATQDALTQDQMALRRRARRRLVGAIAIALSAVLILPMLFDPEPRPLGPDVDIRIPAPSSAFEAASETAPALPAAVDVEGPSPQLAEPTLPPPAAKPAPATTPVEATAGKSDKAVEKVTEKELDKAAVKPPPPLPKPTGAFASHGFYLQLGAFTSESNARQLQEKVAAAGFRVGTADSNGQYRVRVGPIPEKDRALEMQAKLKAKGFTSVMLGP